MRYGRIISIVCALFFMSGLMPGCSSYKTIPDRVMVNIFKDIFLANAYIQTEQGVQPQRDSLDVYRPILARYDYTMKDFEYTIANFSKRKSVKLSDVVNRAILELENEESELRYRASILDTLDVRAQRAYTYDIIRDSSIMATAVRDTALLTVTLPVRKGIYEVGYFYQVDSTDKNRQLKTTYQLTDADGRITNIPPPTTWMTSRRRSRVDQPLVTSDRDSLLTLRFGNYPQDLARPHLTIDSLTVIFKPTVSEAHDSLDRVNMPYKLILDRWR